MKKSRAIAASAGTLVGFGALVSYNVLHAALADPSVPLPPDTNLDTPVLVEASAGTWAYARSPQLGLTTSVNPTTVTPGSRITYSYSVQNLSTDTAFTNVTVTDDKCQPVTFVSGDTNADKQLSVGETWKYTCATTIVKDQQNNAKVTARAVVSPSASPSPSVTPTVTSTPSPTPTVTPSKVIVDGTYLGSLATVTVPGEGISYQVQVQAVISGGRLAAITMPVHTETDVTSRNIIKFNVATTAALNADPTAPTMIYEAITGNTANIATISGATYTTAGFKASLQTALTAAGY
jgi:uncharacterized repeat protein (TIGR01451 family)